MMRYDDLMKQVNPEAHRIALALELFTVGSLNVFSHLTFRIWVKI